MKTKAAVAWQAGKPLTIEEVELQGPKAGEVLVEINKRCKLLNFANHSNKISFIQRNQRFDFIKCKSKRYRIKLFFKSEYSISLFEWTKCQQ